MRCERPRSALSTSARFTFTELAGLHRPRIPHPAHTHTSRTQPQRHCYDEYSGRRTYSPGARNEASSRSSNTMSARARSWSAFKGRMRAWMNRQHATVSPTAYRIYPSGAASDCAEGKGGKKGVQHQDPPTYVHEALQRGPVLRVVMQRHFERTACQQVVALGPGQLPKPVPQRHVAMVQLHRLPNPYVRATLPTRESQPKAAPRTAAKLCRASLGRCVSCWMMPRLRKARYFMRNAGGCVDVAAASPPVGCHPISPPSP